MSYEFPESVFEYLTDNSVRAGVNSIADNALKKLPAGLEWNEIPSFYRAVLATQQVQVEWALAMDALWRDVWPHAVPGWKAMQPYEQSAEYDDVDVSVAKCWSEEWFGRCFIKPARNPSPRPRRSRREDGAIFVLGVSLAPSYELAERVPSRPQ